MILLIDISLILIIEIEVLMTKLKWFIFIEYLCMKCSFYILQYILPNTRQIHS